MTDTPVTPAAPPERPRMPDLNWPDAHRAQLQMRYSDIDTNHHVNNGRYGEYLENARIMFLHDLGLLGQDDRAVLARMEMDYVREILWGQALVVESLIERVGRSSWTLVSRVLADEVPCAFARTVIVRVNAEHRPEPIPDGIRDALVPFMVRAGIT